MHDLRRHHGLQLSIATSVQRTFEAPAVGNLTSNLRRQNMAKKKAAKKKAAKKKKI
jgi:hypothetical protein